MTPLLQVEYNFEEWPVAITWREDYMVCQVCGILPATTEKWCCWWK